MKDISRRDFFNKSATVAAAGYAIPYSKNKFLFQDTDEKHKIKRYKPFGKTGFMVSDISAGAGHPDPAMVIYEYEKGINLFDTAAAYANGRQEENIGKALKNIPREKVFIVSKWHPEKEAKTDSKAVLLEELDKSLKRLNTDYVDCMMVHSYGDPSLGDIDRIQKPALYEAFDEAKKLGKMKFSGASSHGVREVEETQWIVDNDKIDVLLLGANLMTHGLEPLLKKAREKGIATIAMKTMAVYKSELNIPALRNDQVNSRQAVLKYMLAHDLFDTHIIAMNTYDRINEYLEVSGTSELTAEEQQKLKTVTSAISPMYCRPGCSSCYGSCPNNVPIWDVLRYKMYFENYGNEKYAMEKYMNLPADKNVNACTDCSAPCEDNCTYGLKVRDRLMETHGQLTLT